MNTKLFALLLGGTALATAAVRADALIATAEPHYRSYPGVACQPFHGGADGYRDVDGSIRNNTGSWHDYICPVRVDDIWGESQKLDVKTQVIDAHNNARVTCHIYTYTKTRLPYGWDMEETSKGGYSSSPQEQRFAQVTAPEDGHAVVRCSVPPAQGSNISRLVAYHVDN